VNKAAAIKHALHDRLVWRLNNRCHISLIRGLSNRLDGQLWRALLNGLDQRAVRFDGAYTNGLRTKLKHRQ